MISIGIILFLLSITLIILSYGMLLKRRRRHSNHLADLRGRIKQAKELTATLMQESNRKANAPLSIKVNILKKQVQWLHAYHKVKT